MNPNLPSWYKRRIYAPTTDFEHDAVRYVQRVLRADETGELDEQTKSRIQGFQMLFGLAVNGVIDDATAEQVNRVFPEGL